MAGRGLGSLTLQLIIGLGGFTAPLDKAGRTLNSKMSAMEKRAYAFGRAIGTALKIGFTATATATTALAVAVKSAIDRADELSKAAQKIGVTTEALSRLAYAADLSDVSLEQLQGGLGKLIKYQAAAAQGNKEAIKTFQAFGIAIVDATGHLRDTQSVLQDWARVFASLPDGPEKSALALRVFGKAESELIPLLNSGKTGLAEMAAEADRLGITISTQAGKEAEHFNDQLTTLKATLTGVATQIASDLLPDLIDMANGLQNTAEKAALVEKLEDVFHVVAVAGKLVGGVIQFIVDAVQALTSSVISAGLAASAQVKFLRGDLKGALADARAAKAEFGAALDAGAETRALLNGDPATAPSFVPTKYGQRHGGSGVKRDESDRATADAAKKLLATTKENTSATRGNSDAKRAAADAAREQADREAKVREEIKKATDATAEFNKQLEDLIAQQGGPLAESTLKYKRAEEDLRKLHEAGSIPNAEQLTIALNALYEARDKDAEAIRKQLDTGGERLKQMQNELDLLNMQTQAERDRAAFLLDNPTATDEQADAAARLSGQIDESRKAISAMDDFRSSFQDNVEAVAKGTESIGDFFKNMADEIISQLIRIAAQKLTSSLFGEQGTTGGGLFGNLLALFGGGSGGSGGGGSDPYAGFIGSIFGSGPPGYASGTNFASGGWSVVGERGPELVNLPRGSEVIPNNRMRSAGGFTQVVNNHYKSPESAKTREQVAKDMAMQGQLATRRN